MSKTPAPFDPLDTGPSDQRWRQTLRSVAPWAPQPREVVIVSPHPDDEVLGVGGLIATLSGRGVGITVVSVTDGERAYRGVPGLARLRRQELQHALRTLAPLARIVHLGIPDGAVTSHQAQLSDTLREFTGPHVLLIAPYEFDGHPDHEAAARAAMSIGVPVARYPIWMWHRCTPARMPPLRLGRFLLGPRIVRAKAAALRAFRSQIAPIGRPPILPSNVLRYFRRPYETLVLP